jgi:hypothetical protein
VSRAEALAILETLQKNLQPAQPAIPIGLARQIGSAIAGPKSKSSAGKSQPAPNKGQEKKIVSDLLLELTNDRSTIVEKLKSASSDADRVSLISSLREKEALIKAEKKRIQGVGK